MEKRAVCERESAEVLVGEGWAEGDGGDEKVGRIEEERGQGGEEAEEKEGTATKCNTLQHTAIHCNTLQHASTLFNTQTGI